MAGMAIVSIAVSAYHLRAARRPEAAIAFSWSHLFQRDLRTAHKSRTQNLMEGGFWVVLGLAIIGELAGEFLGWW